METRSSERIFSIEEAVQFGLGLHKLGRLTEAEVVYRQILATRPEHADACHLMGLLMFQLGRKEDAETWMKRAVASAPDHADAHNNLGNLHKTAGRLAEAEAAYRRVLTLRPDSAAAHNNLGIVLKEQGRFHEAIDCFLKAIALEPEFADAHYNRGNALARQEKWEEAIEAYNFTLSLEPEHLEALEKLAETRRKSGMLAEASEILQKAKSVKMQRARDLFEKATEARKRGLSNEAIAFLREAIGCQDDFTPAYNSLGFILNILGRTEDAVATWRQWLQREPGNAIARHMIASATGEQVPDRASDAFVKTTFEGFASSFDEKLKSLQYQAPDLIVQAVGNALGAPSQNLDVLDAGCGTGLCGAGLRPFSRRLTGVDLSPAMLAKARERSFYDDLVEGELTSFLESAPSAYNVIVSADTLVYFGALERVVAAAGNALRPSGLLAFTLEKIDGIDPSASYLLHHRGRYSHAAEYVRKVLQAAGLGVKALTDVTLRMESGKPVPGFVVVAGKD